MKDGFIRPNTGSFPFSHAQSEFSATYNLGGISLLDFTIPDDQIFFAEEDPVFTYVWEQMLIAHDPVTVIFKIQKETISDGIVEWEKIRETSPSTLIPFIETCCLDPIPVEVIKATVFIYSRDPSRFVEFEDIEIDEKRIMSFAKELKDSGMET